MKKYSISNYAKIISSVVIMALAVTLFILAFFVESRSGDATVGPGFFPQIVASLLFILGVADLTSNIRKFSFLKKNNKLIPKVTEKKAFKTVFCDNLDWVSGILILVYVIAIYYIGFLIPSIIYMFLQILLYTTTKKRNWILYTILSLAIPAIIYFGFRNYFHLMLPAGILG